MSTDAIMDYITKTGRTGRLEFQISIQCAPVLKGIKASNLVTTARDSLEAVKNGLAFTEIIPALLATGTRTETLFLYRPAMFHALLAGEELRRFLKGFGYCQFDAASVLMRLKRRYTAYLAGEINFPHELGALLQYPLADVKDFIRQNGENYLFTGYWKVYHDPVQAKLQFSRYDRARETAMQQIMDGCSLREVAVRKGDLR